MFITLIVCRFVSMLEKKHVTVSSFSDTFSVIQTYLQFAGKYFNDQELECTSRFSLLEIKKQTNQTSCKALKKGIFLVHYKLKDLNPRKTDCVICSRQNRRAYSQARKNWALRLKRVKRYERLEFAPYGNDLVAES